MIRLFKWMIGILFLLVISIIAIIYFGAYHPRAIEHVTLISPDTAPKLSPGQKLKVMSWNVQYMAGTDYVFWYEGGTDPRPSSEDIQKTTQQVAQIILRENPDIILLQEVDQGASRSYREDQLASLLNYLPAEYQAYSSAFYWKALFVPHPQIWGSVGMKLAVISKFQINGAIRHQLAAIDRKVQNWYDPLFFWLERQFQLKVALLEISLPLEKGGNFRVYNTHLTAYPGKGSTVLTQQVTYIEKLLAQKDFGRIPWLIGGDFNLLPPGVSSNDLHLTEGEFYNPQTEIQTLYKKYEGFPKSVVAPGTKPPFTYIPNQKENRKADRTLDYFFISPQLGLDTAYVFTKNTFQISDHYPILMHIKLPAGE